jgi:hypothetical protein
MFCGWVKMASPLTERSETKMSNQSFDRSYKQGKLQDARTALAGYEAAFRQPNLSIEDYEFLNRAIGAEKRRVAQWEILVKAWWC